MCGEVLVQSVQCTVYSVHGAGGWGWGTHLPLVKIQQSESGDLGELDESGETGDFRINISDSSFKETVSVPHLSHL